MDAIEMAMKPGEMVDFFRGQRDMFQGHVATAVSQDNLDWAASNLSIAYRAAMMSALIAWRHDLGNPVADLRAAVEIANEAAGALQRLFTRAPAWTIFNFGAAAIADFLLRGSIDTSLSSLVAPQAAEASAIRDHADQYLDGALVRSLTSGFEEDSLRRAVESLPETKRLLLLRESYMNYAEIVGDCQNSIETKIRNGEALFKRRSRDSYFSGGAQTEGGGPDNANVVDYRLAAVLKSCSLRQSVVADTIHAWRF